MPQFVVPEAPGDNPAGEHHVGHHPADRLTLVGLVPEFGGGALSGELDVDFFGGQQPSSGGRTFPLLRLRRAFAELTWPRAALLVGQEAPPIAMVSPSSLAAIGFPEFAGAGNLWLWIPQVRLSGDLAPHNGVRFGAEAAVLAPTSGEPQADFLTHPIAPSEAAGPTCRAGCERAGGQATRPRRSASADTTAGWWTPRVIGWIRVRWWPAPGFPSAAESRSGPRRLPVRPWRGWAAGASVRAWCATGCRCEPRAGGGR